MNAMRSAARVNVSLFHTVNSSTRTLSVANMGFKAAVSSVRFSSVRSFSVVVENLESLGDSITSAVLLSWNKQPGDSIAEDDVIAVVETDKVTMDIRAKKAGVFVEGLVAAQGNIIVGSPLFKFVSEGAAAAAPDKAAPTAPAAPKAAAPAAAQGTAPAKAASTVMVAVPIMGESITTGVLSSWSVKVGADHVVATIGSDNPDVQVRTPTAGRITKLFFAQGDVVNVGKPLLALSAGEKGTKGVKSAALEPALITIANFPREFGDQEVSARIGSDHTLTELLRSTSSVALMSTATGEIVLNARYLVSGHTYTLERKQKSRLDHVEDDVSRINGYVANKAKGFEKEAVRGLCVELQKRYHGDVTVLMCGQVLRLDGRDIGDVDGLVAAGKLACLLEVKKHAKVEDVAQTLKLAAFINTGKADLGGVQIPHLLVQPVLATAVLDDAVRRAAAAANVWILYPVDDSFKLE